MMDPKQVAIIRILNRFRPEAPDKKFHPKDLLFKWTARFYIEQKAFEDLPIEAILQALYQTREKMEQEFRDSIAFVESLSAAAGELDTL